MIRRRCFLKILTVMAASVLLLPSCGTATEAAEGSTPNTAATAAEEPAEAPAQTEETEAPAQTEEAEAPAQTEETGASEEEQALPDLYAMELYDDVPDEYLEWHDDVDYGTIEADVQYYSETAGDYKYCNVLLPPGYDPSQEYPVLYMFHGFGGRYDSHVHEGSILQTLYGNMLREGLTVPMIIVGADMYTDLLSEKDGKTDAEMRPCYDKGVDDLALDLMPFIESHYSVKKGRLNTAVTGVSQGATTALAAGFKWQSKIGYTGSFAPCPGVIPTPFYEGSFWNWPILDDFTIESAQTMPRYIYLTVGTEDPWCIDSTAYYHEILDEKGIPNEYRLVEGYEHGNDLWALGHYNMLRKVFVSEE